MTFDDIDYILAEEGRYGISSSGDEEQEIMEYGLQQIRIDEILYTRPTSSSLTEKSAAYCCWDEENSYPEDDEPVEPDYDIKVRGGENYHLNKLKAKPHSPKRERKQKREKHIKDHRAKESRCHKKKVDDL